MHCSKKHKRHDAARCAHETTWLSPAAGSGRTPRCFVLGKRTALNRSRGTQRSFLVTGSGTQSGRVAWPRGYVALAQTGNAVRGQHNGIWSPGAAPGRPKTGCRSHPAAVQKRRRAPPRAVQKRRRATPRGRPKTGPSGLEKPPRQKKIQKPYPKTPPKTKPKTIPKFSSNFLQWGIAS